MTQGPLGYDAELAHKALVGLGTNEILLTELILGRSVAEIRLLIEGYQKKYNKDLVSDVKSDLSGKIESSVFLFLYINATNGLTDFIGSVRHGFEWTTSPRISSSGS